MTVGRAWELGMAETLMTGPAGDLGKPGRRRWGVIVVEPLAAITRARRARVIALVGLDLRGERDAAWLIREIRRRHPTHAILAVGSDADPTGISRALFVGADGFVDKEVEPDAFIAAIRQVRERETVLVGPPPVAIGMIAEKIEQRRD